MPRERDDLSREAELLFLGLSDSIDELTDAEILEEIEHEGLKVAQVVDQVSQVIAQAVKHDGQAKLQKAREEHRTKTASLQTQHVELPSGRQGMLDLLAATLTAQPSLKPALTVQFRKLDELADGDLKGLLRQLAELNALTFDEPED